MAYAVKSLAVTLGIGLATGVLTSRGQTYLPNGASQFANSYAVWLTASFLVGALLSVRGWAIAGGVLVQFAALAGYYLAAQLFLGAPPGNLAIVAFWAIGGICGGPFLGLAGYWWQRSAGWRALVAGALPGALYLSEGLYLLLALHYRVGYAFLLVGIGLAAGLARRALNAPRGVAIAVPLGLLLYVCYRYGFGFLYERLTLP